MRAHLSAGNNSTQNISVGISVNEATEIVDDRIAREFGNFRSSADQMLVERLEYFEKSLVASLVQAGRLDAAGDPNLWVAIQKAAVEAAGSDSNRDLDFLVDLLTERTKSPSDRRFRTSIDGAIRVITALDDETLAGITALYVVTTLNPRVFTTGLLRMQNILLEKVLPEGFPRDNGWIEHAANVGAARTVIGLKPLSDYLADRLAYCLSPGVADGTAEAEAATETSWKVGWPVTYFSHPYKEGYSVAPWNSVEQVKQNCMEKTGATPEEAQTIADGMRELWHVGEIDPECRAKFLEELNSLKCLTLFGEGMARFDPPIILTEVGRVVGRANLKRLSPDFPQEGVLYV